MRKIIFLFSSLLLIFILSGCSNKSAQKTKESLADNNPLQQQEQTEISSSVSVGYIDFEATVVTSENFDALNIEFDGQLDKAMAESTTQILLTLNNHRTDVTAFDYQKLSTLDGSVALSWQQFSERMGGHHVGGVLTFPKVGNPRVLIVTGLPVGEAILTF